MLFLLFYLHIYYALSGLCVQIFIFLLIFSIVYSFCCCREFVERLTTLTHEQIPSGRILWYDSITVDGLLLWQNELNDKNR